MPDKDTTTMDTKETPADAARAPNTANAQDTSPAAHVHKPTAAEDAVAKDEPKVRLTSGMEYFLDDFYVKAGTAKAEEVKNRTKPRNMEEGDPLIRGFVWGGTPAFECRYVVEFQGPEDGPTWKMACCKTYFTLEQVAQHWRDEHDGEVLPEFAP